MSKTGLVLEGGGMRGIFSAGVLDAFLDYGISFENCIGVSAGACHACSFLAGQRERSFKISTEYLNDKRYCSLHSLITTGDLFGVDMSYNLIPRVLNPIDNEAFLKNPTVFQAVVTNCKTGEAEYPFIKDLFKDLIYIRASSSLPGFSRMVEIDGIRYLDGGITDSIPLRQSIKEGCAKNVVVLTQVRDYRKEPMSMKNFFTRKYRRYPKLVSAMERRHEMYNDTLDFIAGEEKAGRAFVIAPPHPLGLKRIEKDAKKMKESYDTGYNEAKRLIPEIKAFL
ncbi:MAG: patatin family protein [Lachnospiraceae bacterium]|nr:patatin family protein [Lachnospiraceae bacterium]